MGAFSKTPEEMHADFLAAYPGHRDGVPNDEPGGIDRTVAPGGPKEDAYDAEIAPLMARIIAACRAAKINFAAAFYLDTHEGSPVVCRTILPVDGDDHVGAAGLAAILEVTE